MIFALLEELLDLQSLTGTTKGGDIFEALSVTIQNLNLPWDKLCGVTMDGAPVMTGGVLNEYSRENYQHNLFESTQPQRVLGHSYLKLM